MMEHMDGECLCWTCTNSDTLRGIEAKLNAKESVCLNDLWVKMAEAETSLALLKQMISIQYPDTKHLTVNEILAATKEDNNGS